MRYRYLRGLAYKMFKTGPRSEVDYLRQKILKHLEYQNQLLSIQITIVSAILGVGVKTGESMFLLVIPPIVLVFLCIYKNHMIEQIRITGYIEEVYYRDEYLSIGEYNEAHAPQPGCFANLMRFGKVSVFIVVPLIALLIGYMDHNRSRVINILLVVDYASVFLIGIVLYAFRWEYIDDYLSKGVSPFQRNKTKLVICLIAIIYILLIIITYLVDFRGPVDCHTVVG